MNDENPGLSILKPLKNVDFELAKNLRTFFELKYDRFQLIFALQNPQDPALEIVQSLMQEFPNVDAQLVVSDDERFMNPKVSNLLRAYDLAKYDRILISDSNTQISTELVLDMIQELNSDVGVVTAVVSGQNVRSVGAMLESNYLNTFYTRWMLLSHWSGFPCVVGKAMMFKRSLAERFGGLRNLHRYLAEDYMTGVAVQFLGLRVGISKVPVVQNLGPLSLPSFWKRHLRWGRIRKAQAPFAFMGEPLATCLMSGVALWLWSGSSLAFGAHILAWSLCDWFLAHQIHKQSLIPYFFSWSIREITAPIHWLQMAMDNRVEWRGKTLTLERGGTLKV